MGELISRVQLIDYSKYMIEKMDKKYYMLKDFIKKPRPNKEIILSEAEYNEIYIDIFFTLAGKDPEKAYKIYNKVKNIMKYYGYKLFPIKDNNCIPSENYKSCLPPKILNITSNASNRIMAKKENNNTLDIINDAIETKNRFNEIEYKGLKNPNKDFIRVSYTDTHIIKKHIYDKYAPITKNEFKRLCYKFRIIMKYYGYVVPSWITND